MGRASVKVLVHDFFVVRALIFLSEQACQALSPCLILLQFLPFSLILLFFKELPPIGLVLCDSLEGLILSVILLLFLLPGSVRILLDFVGFLFNSCMICWA